MPVSTTTTESAAGPPPRTKKEGNIGSVFASFTGGDTTLPPEYARFKREIVHSPELATKITDSWHRLLKRLEDVTAEIATRGSDMIPEVDFHELHRLPESTRDAVREAGTVVIRGVAQRAPEWERMLRQYVTDNPVTGFPKDNPQVFEVYWSPAQMAARSDAAVLEAQRWANKLWHNNADREYPVDLGTAIAYADRARMRNPGDKNFNLGPHSDCGSIELWEHDGYRRCYADIFRGEWEKYDAYDATLRDQTNTNLHDADAYCGVFRTWQGWLALSDTGAGEGTLLVFPLLREATAYFALRPFFSPLNPPKNGDYTDANYLAAENWVLDLDSASYPGSVLGKTQELSAETHPHLRLDKTMVPMRRVRPGDYVLWHCEGIHAVEPVHNGTKDSSVLYMAPCPLTERNARHLAEQRECFKRGESGPDFPAGPGEAAFKDRGMAEDVKSYEARRAMGLESFDVDPEGGFPFAAGLARCRANRVLFGF